MTCYKFDCALGAFFEIDSDVAKELLPKKLNPLERRPGCSILNIAAFDFTESEVGAYGEIVFSIAVSPYSKAGEVLPHIGLFPFQLATTTAESKAHGSEKWKLPCHPEIVSMEFHHSESTRTVIVKEEQDKILELSISRTDEKQNKQINRIYQCFTFDSELHRVNIEISGEINEHEEETGAFSFSDHALCEQISALEDDIPFREQSMGRGKQLFADLTLHKT